MQKDFYNQNTATPSKESDPTTLLHQLLSGTSPLSLIAGTQNLNDIINISEANRVQKRRGRRSEHERSRSISLRNLDAPELDGHCFHPLQGAGRHKLSLADERELGAFGRRGSGAEVEAFVKLPPKKAKNEIVRLPESAENQQHVDLGATDFQSDSEGAIPADLGLAADCCEVVFVNKETRVHAKKIQKAEGRVFDLVDFVTRRDDKTRLNKVYACKYCPKVYAKRAALGGHTAKNHPHLSDSYKVRQISMNSRKIERERFDFFKHL